MTQLEERVRHLFGVSIEAKITAADALSPVIAQAGLRLVNCLLNDGRLFFYVGMGVLLLIVCNLQWLCSIITMLNAHLYP